MILQNSLPFFSGSSRAIFLKDLLKDALGLFHPMFFRIIFFSTYAHEDHSQDSFKDFFTEVIVNISRVGRHRIQFPGLRGWWGRCLWPWNADGRAFGYFPVAPLLPRHRPLNWLNLVQLCCQRCSRPPFSNPIIFLLEFIILLVKYHLNTKY